MSGGPAEQAAEQFMPLLAEGKGAGGVYSGARGLLAEGGGVQQRPVHCASPPPLAATGVQARPAGLADAPSPGGCAVPAIATAAAVSAHAHMPTATSPCAFPMPPAFVDVDDPMPDIDAYTVLRGHLETVTFRNRAMVSA